MHNTDLFKNKKKELVNGYAETKFVKSYVFFPKNVNECIEIIENCKKKNLKICCRGSGLSYGDIITNNENVLLDFTLMNKIISWNNESGIIRLQPGTTFAQVFNFSLIENWTLSACPGSFDITIGGAVSNNVHGKDSYKNGNFGNQILEFKLLLASGKIIVVNSIKNNSLFKAVVGGMGLIGIIVEIKIQLKKIPSPFVRVTNKVSKNIFDTLDYIESIKENCDFSVAWVDCFAKKDALGRGFVTSAKWTDAKYKVTENELEKSLTKSNKIFGMIPAKKTWHMTKFFFQPSVIKKLNYLFYKLNLYSDFLSINKEKIQLFTKYNFMHNKIPDIKYVYRPEGFLEFQPILPKENIKNNLKDLIKLCQKFNSESLLCAVKVHSPDNNLISFESDGYSIGIDIQINKRRKEDIIAFSREIFSFTANLQGKVFLAKDEYLDKSHFKKMYPQYLDFLKVKNEYDPQNVFTSDLFKRLF